KGGRRLDDDPRTLDPRIEAAFDVELGLDRPIEPGIVRLEARRAVRRDRQLQGLLEILAGGECERAADLHGLADRLLLRRDDSGRGVALAVGAGFAMLPMFDRDEGDDDA